MSLIDNLHSRSTGIFSQNGYFREEGLWAWHARPRELTEHFTIPNGPNESVMRWHTVEAGSDCHEEWEKMRSKPMSREDQQGYKIYNAFTEKIKK